MRPRHLLLLSLVAFTGCDPSAKCDTLNTWFEDRDVDGFGTDAVVEQTCGDAPSGYVATGGDCDDRDAAVFPGAAEVCGDGKVNDCGADAAEVVAACTVSGEVTASVGSGAVVQGAATDAAGSAVASAGDVDGDDVQELLVGAPGAAGGAGEAWLYYGGDDGALEADDSWVRFIGESVGDEAGAALAGLGDLNSDGDSDIGVGAPGADGEAGRAYIILQDLDNDLPLADADLVFTGANAGDRAGAAIAGVGDFNGDDALDVAIGAPGADDSTGRVYLITAITDGAYDLADATRVLTGLAAGSEVGAALLGMDLTGDGDMDLVVGAPGAALSADPGEDDVYPGAVYAYLENFVTETSLQEAEIKLNGDMDESRAGTTIKNLGDVTGDGYDDLGIGAPRVGFGGTRTGSVYVMAGPVEALTYRVLRDVSYARLDGVSADDRAGVSVEGPGDVDGDGLDDILVGAPDEGSELEGRGAVYLAYGPISASTSDGTDLTIASVIYTGEEAGAALGTALAGVGDQDNNGTAEILAGAPGAGSGAGAAYLLRAAGY